VFWYSGKYIHSIVNTKKALAAQLVYNSHFDLLAEVTISSNGHNIVFYSGKNPVGCQILSNTWDFNTLINPDLTFSLEKNLYFDAQGKWEIFATEYDKQEINESVAQKNSLFYEIEKGKWIVINWFLTQNKAYFLSLHSNPKENINLWTKSEYEVLSIKLPNGRLG
jgi:hypothetical protein